MPNVLRQKNFNVNIKELCFFFWYVVYIRAHFTVLKNGIGLLMHKIPLPIQGGGGGVFKMLKTLYKEPLIVLNADVGISYWF